MHDNYISQLFIELLLLLFLDNITGMQSEGIVFFLVMRLVLGAGSWLRNSDVPSALSTKRYNDFGQTIRIYPDQGLASRLSYSVEKSGVFFVWLDSSRKLNADRCKRSWGGSMPTPIYPTFRPLPYNEN